VALDAVLDIADTFFGMHGLDLARLMLMAAKAGIAAEIPAGMAGSACSLMGAGQCEEAGMLEGRRLPT
jgi:hypothetical protein